MLNAIQPWLPLQQIVQKVQYMVQIVLAYMKIRPYVITYAWKDREFIIAFKRVLREKSLEEFIATVSQLGIPVIRYSIKEAKQELKIFKAKKK